MHNAEISRSVAIGCIAFVIPHSRSERALDTQRKVPSAAFIVTNLCNDFILKGNKYGEYITSAETSANLTGGSITGGTGRRNVCSSPAASTGMGGMFCVNPTPSLPVRVPSFSNINFPNPHLIVIDFTGSKLLFLMTKKVENGFDGSSEFEGLIDILGEKA